MGDPLMSGLIPDEMMLNGVQILCYAFTAGMALLGYLLTLRF